MRRRIAIGLMGFVFVSLCTNVIAEALPKSGKISLHSINKGTSTNKYNDEYTHGTVNGVTFNELGNGPFHMGKTACSYSIFSHKDIRKSAGFCSYEDKEGDKLFIQYAGTSNAEGEWNGIDNIIGGTGKYKESEGSGPYTCTNTHKGGEFPCTTKLEYRLP